MPRGIRGASPLPLRPDAVRAEVLRTMVQRCAIGGILAAILGISVMHSCIAEYSIVAVQH